jgi:hypothetical protein
MNYMLTRYASSGSNAMMLNASATSAQNSLIAVYLLGASALIFSGAYIYSRREKKPN